jgi:P-type conjugative transfer ATPase TrbB
MTHLDYQDDQVQDSVKARAKIKLERDLGPVIMGALADPKTVEIMLNADGKLWQERLGEKMQQIGTLSASRSESIIKTLAGFHGKEINKGRPLLECELPIDGSRFAGQFPPIVPAPTFAIRKKAIAIFTLTQYVATGIMTPAQLVVIEAAVKNHRNILVTGSTGSGKTTLVNAIINHMVVIDPSERIVIIEDTGEIQCAADNFVQYHTTLDISMTLLLRTSLRMRPDRLLVGEVRGPEALDLLMAWNTGHEGGAATLHANHARAGLVRMAQLISMHPDAPKHIEPLISEAVQLVIHIARTQDGRRVEEIVEIQGYEDGHYLTQTVGV